MPTDQGLALLHAQSIMGATEKRRDGSGRRDVGVAAWECISLGHELSEARRRGALAGDGKSE